LEKDKNLQNYKKAPILQALLKFSQLFRNPAIEHGTWIDLW
jgi:hypothetical protein